MDAEILLAPAAIHAAALLASALAVNL